ncbi:MAG: hypothetical protein ACK2T4_01695 [Candidatus Promineifilaceae bacterium]|jgi:hypothetical protein
MMKLSHKTKGNPIWVPLFFIFLLSILAACGSPEEEADQVVETPVVQTPVEELAEVSATETPLPVATNEVEPEPTEPPPPTSTTIPTSTIKPTSTAETATETPEATATDTPEPTATATQPAPTSPPAAVEPQATTAVEAQPTTAPIEPTAEPAATEPAAEPVLGVNLLPNPSFEEGHYNQDGVPELQLPNKWRLEWDTGPTGVGNEAWDVYVRPEVRVLSTAFLPPEEHNLYIYNGQNTVKAFKGSGAVSFRLLTDITLEPGTYVIEAKMFPDIVEKWENRQKVWSQDPSAAEFHFIVGDGGTVWTPQNYGQINVYNFTFTIDETKTIPIGIALKGKYALANNGWFIDDLSVRRIE